MTIPAPKAPRSRAANPAANDTEVAVLTRQPVTVTGLDLLKLLAATNGAFLTKAEASDAIASGHALVDTSRIEGDTAFVSLTDAGSAFLAASAAEKELPVFDVDKGYAPTVSAKKRGGKRGSKYPFASLEVGDSFHVPKTKAMPNPVSALASSLTGARRKYEIPVLENGEPVIEKVKVKTYATDASGKRLKVAGKFVVSGETFVEKPKMQQTRDFYVVEAAPDDPRGPGARVVRSK